MPQRARNIRRRVIVLAVALVAFALPVIPANALVAAVTVTKTATPTSRPEPGGDFTFEIVVSNTGLEPITIDSLTDDVYGDLADRGTCNTAPGTLLLPLPGVLPMSTYTCSFTVAFNGDAGDTETNTTTVVATSILTQEVSDTDDETIRITADPGPGGAGLEVEKTIRGQQMENEEAGGDIEAPEPGGVFNYRVRMTNTGDVPLTIDAIDDSVHGDVTDGTEDDGNCPDAVGEVIPVGGFTTCIFLGTFTGEAGDTETDTVTVSALPPTGPAVSDSDSARITLIGPASFTVSKTASPPSRPIPGGTYTFTVVVTNTGTSDVIVTDIEDDVYDDIGDCEQAGGRLKPGGSLTCSFDGQFVFAQPSQQTDTITVTALDEVDNQLQESDSATVRIVSEETTLDLTKTCDPEDDVLLPGGSVLCTVSVTNTGGVAATNVEMVDTLPDGFVFDSVVQVSGFESCGGENAGTQVRCTDTSLPAGATDSVTYRAVLDDDEVGGGETFQNDAVVTANNAVGDEASATVQTPDCTVTGSGQFSGTDGDDVICGSEGNDQIAGLDGDDIIFGGGGDDQINGGGGDDRLFGGAGDDQVAGGPGNDQVNGGPGSDSLAGNSGNDSADGGAGDDDCAAELTDACEQVAP